jgi:hypothetical protein
VVFIELEKSLVNSLIDSLIELFDPYEKILRGLNIIINNINFIFLLFNKLKFLFISN